MIDKSIELPAERRCRSGRSNSDQQSSTINRSRVMKSTKRQVNSKTKSYQKPTCQSVPKTHPSSNMSISELDTQPRQITPPDIIVESEVSPHFDSTEHPSTESIVESLLNRQSQSMDIQPYSTNQAIEEMMFVVQLPDTRNDCGILVARTPSDEGNIEALDSTLVILLSIANKLAETAFSNKLI